MKVVELFPKTETENAKRADIFSKILEMSGAVGIRPVDTEGHTTLVLKKGIHITFTTAEWEAFVSYALANIKGVFE